MRKLKRLAINLCLLFFSSLVALDLAEIALTIMLISASNQTIPTGFAPSHHKNR